MAALAAETPPTSAVEAQKIAELRAEIARHDELYHRQAKPEIADAEYDGLKRRLAEWERTSPESAKAAKRAKPLAEIGDDRSGLFPTQRHRAPMLSLEKAHTTADLRAFHARLAKAFGHDDLAYVVEPKVDGLAVSVTYENGKLARAVTRGNGIEGDDITANALRIAGLPRELRATPGDRPWPRLVEVRGEIYVPRKDFERVNVARELAGEPPFANPRNLAAGTVRQLDPEEVARRGLRSVFFGVGACEPADGLPETQRGLYSSFNDWGLPVLPEVWTVRGGADRLVRMVETANQARGRLGFATDGAVVKLDSSAQQQASGASETAPRWAVAYKFAPLRAETRLRAIAIQVGRTGVLTPVAELEPVELDGSTVARATLHHRGEIARKAIRVGDFVYVEKAGEVIPAIVGVNLDRRAAGAAPYVFPGTCPACDTPVVPGESEAAVRCPELACPAQVRRRIEHFASKACLDIEGMGPATVALLVERGGVKDAPGLYRLRRDDLLTLGKDNAKSVDLLLAAIERSKRAELWRVVHGLGLPNVGAATARDLARQHESLAALAENGSRAIPALGEERYRRLIAELVAAGVGGELTAQTVPAISAARVSSTGPLANKTFVLTGTLAGLTRAQATAKIEEAGGKVAGAVSRATDYVVVGANPGAKLAQARSLGVPTLDEATFLRLLEAR